MIFHDLVFIVHVFECAFMHPDLVLHLFLVEEQVILPIVLVRAVNLHEHLLALLLFRDLVDDFEQVGLASRVGQEVHEVLVFITVRAFASLRR